MVKVYNIKGYLKGRDMRGCWHTRKSCHECVWSGNSCWAV